MPFLHHAEPTDHPPVKTEIPTASVRQQKTRRRVLVDQQSCCCCGRHGRHLHRNLVGQVFCERCWADVDLRRSALERVIAGDS